MADEPTRVVHVLGRLDIGGAERMLLSLCKSIPIHTARHTVIALSGRSGSLTSAFAEAGVGQELCSMKPPYSFAWRLSRTLHRLRPDVVISHVSLASGVILLVARLTGIPRRVAVFHSDGDGHLPQKRRIYRFLMRLFLRLNATDAVGVTASTLKFGGVSAARRVSSSVIPNAVDLTAFRLADRRQARQELGLCDDGVLLMHAGRAAPEKNRRALPRLLAELGAETQLVLAGASTIDDLDLSNNDPLMKRIHVVGAVAHIGRLLAASNVLVLPSIREGLPLVVLEALASGRPVVATDLPGIRLAAEQLPHIHLVPLGSSPKQYARAVEVVLRTPHTPEEIRLSLAGSRFDLSCALDFWTDLCRRNP